MKLAITLVISLAACGGEADISATTGSSTTTQELTMPSTAPDYEGEFRLMVERARADLATRLGEKESAIEVISAEGVTWSDGSLGCPQPGMMYTQALVEGSRVVLSHGERFYDYHAGTDDQSFLCESEAEDGGHDSVPPLEGTAST